MWGRRACEGAVGEDGMEYGRISVFWGGLGDGGWAVVRAWKGMDLALPFGDRSRG